MSVSEITLGGNANGTCLQGYFQCSYKDLAHALGPPMESDGYKVSSEWILTFRGNTYTVYDYKETNLYDESLPSVESFRNQPIHTWHIGGIPGIPGERDAFLNALRMLVDTHKEV